MENSAYFKRFNDDQIAPQTQCSSLLSHQQCVSASTSPQLRQHWVLLLAEIFTNLIILPKPEYLLTQALEEGKDFSWRREEPKRWGAVTLKCELSTESVNLCRTMEIFLSRLVSAQWAYRWVGHLPQSPESFLTTGKQARRETSQCQVSRLWDGHMTMQAVSPRGGCDDETGKWA